MMAKVEKQVKFFYYIKAYLRRILPTSSFSIKIKELEGTLTAGQMELVTSRVAYYCRSSVQSSKSAACCTLKDLRSPVTPKTYYHDTYQYARFFPEELPINFVFGDVTTVPDLPSIVKSRPVTGDNQNSVLLNLDKARHFVWIKNDQPFRTKKDVLIGRGAVFQEHRYQFFSRYFGHPLCDLGQVNAQGGNPIWIKKKMSIEDHLNYKFILCLQGNDVATNLKWVMSSNSIAVMPRPTLETWFMEGSLVGGKHYIEIKDDYSDLESQLQYYISNPEECEAIVDNAHRHCEQFFSKKVEDLCSLKVLEKYLLPVE
ncbi:glycosyl transferase family 90 [Marnyiella aurantia]|nr:glycosyl transferase family 90 [Marnyiella aurantia]